MEALNKLRTVVKPYHDQLERLTSEDNMFQRFSVDAYQKFLMAHYYHHYFIKRQIEMQQITLLDWPACPRIEVLRTDLMSLPGVWASKPESDFLNDINFPFSSRESCIGLCYVSEGASRGNKMILSALMKHEGFEKLGAHQFLTTSKEQFKSRWSDLVNLIDDAANSNYNELASGAIFGFESFGRIWRKLSVANSWSH